MRINITFRSKVVRFVKLDPLINYPKSLCCLVCFLEANDSCFNPRQFFLNQHDWRAVNLKLKKNQKFQVAYRVDTQLPPPYAKKQADTHFFINDTHNVIMMLWLRIILRDATCMSGQSLNEKAVKVRHFFVSFTQVLCAKQ